MNFKKYSFTARYFVASRMKVQHSICVYETVACNAHLHDGTVEITVHKVKRGILMGPRSKWRLERHQNSLHWLFILVY